MAVPMQYTSFHCNFVFFPSFYSYFIWSTFSFYLKNYPSKRKQTKNNLLRIFCKLKEFILYSCKMNVFFFYLLISKKKCCVVNSLVLALISQTITLSDYNAVWKSGKLCLAVKAIKTPQSLLTLEWVYFIYKCKQRSSGTHVWADLLF